VEVTERAAFALVLLGACSPPPLPAAGETRKPLAEAARSGETAAPTAPPIPMASPAGTGATLPVAPRPIPEPPAPSRAGTASKAIGDHPMLALLPELVGFLSREPLTVADVVAKIGPIRRDPGVPLDIELAPSVPGVRAARLSRYPDTGKPYLLELDLASPIPVAALRTVFGEPRQARTDRGLPRAVIFSPPGTEPHWTVAVIAEIPAGTTPIEGESAKTVALRRDPR
jgi:hypothetical protein